MPLGPRLVYLNACSTPGLGCTSRSTSAAGGTVTIRADRTCRQGHAVRLVPRRAVGVAALPRTSVPFGASTHRLDSRPMSSTTSAAAREQTAKSAPPIGPPTPGPAADSVLDLHPDPGRGDLRDHRHQGRPGSRLLLARHRRPVDRRERPGAEHDPFSFTWAGQPWTPHEWLSELLMYWLVSGLGRTGALFVFGLFPAAIVISQGLMLSRQGVTSGPSRCRPCSSAWSLRRTSPFGRRRSPGCCFRF